MKTKTNKKIIYAVLHNIRSAYNVGSMFRTADAAGVTRVYLTGYTPTPIDVLGDIRKEIHKTALGAERTVLWEHHNRIGSVFSLLQKKGVCILALEQTANAHDYRSVREETGAIALVVGNEVAGLPKAVLKKCDRVVEIPLLGKKESLNVSVAFGIALFSFLR